MNTASIAIGAALAIAGLVLWIVLRRRDRRGAPTRCPSCGCQLPASNFPRCPACGENT